MPKSRVLQILAKYAEEQPTFALPEGQDPISFSKARENFGYELQMKLTVVLGEIENEISTLKMRNFDPAMQKLFVGVWYRLQEIYRRIRNDDPLKIARELVDYLENKNTKAVINNLEFLGEHHLKQTNVEFKPNKLMAHPRIRSVALLRKLVDFAKTYIAQESPQTLQETYRPPSKNNMPAVNLPAPPKLPSIDLPPTEEQSPEAKKMKEVG